VTHFCGPIADIIHNRGLQTVTSPCRDCNLFTRRNGPRWILPTLRRTRRPNRPHLTQPTKETECTTPNPTPLVATTWQIPWPRVLTGEGNRVANATGLELWAGMGPCGPES